MSEGFRFAHDPAAIRLGPGAVAALDDELAAHSLDDALLVCGRTVGSTPAVVGPVREGLGERLAGTFDETTSAKRLSTALAGVEALRDAGADALVALGGGSSIDAAKAIATLAARDCSAAEAAAEFQETGTLAVPDDPVALVAVPTTLAGADLSTVAGLTASPDADPVDEPVSGGIAGEGLMPRGAVYDPDLVATTPPDVLAASAMNGFDKGVETLYAATATPVTDATAARGLTLLRESLPALRERDPATLRRILEGIVLVQYGTWRGTTGTLSLVHAFGHGLTRTHEVQQGAAHAVVAPHVLAYLFEEVDGRRDLLADALGVPDDRDPAAGVVDAVREVGQSLGLPTRLRDVAGPDPEAFPDVAEAILADGFLDNAPPDLDPTAADIEAVLRAAW